jgi:hypothetical protein
VFNLGAQEFTVLFHDGRVEVDPAYPSSCKTPAGYELPAVNSSDEDVDRIIDFLHALTDPASIDLRNDTPASVPSGLTLAE